MPQFEHKLKSDIQCSVNILDISNGSLTSGNIEPNTLHFGFDFLSSEDIYSLEPLGDTDPPDPLA